MILRPESLLAGDRELLASAADELELPTLSDCSRPAIRGLAQRKGIDFATALLFDRVLRQGNNQEFYAHSCRGQDGHLTDPPLVGIVPGAFYRDHKGTGANGEEVGKILASLGCRTEIVPLKSFGSLCENASILLNWLAEHKGRRLALVSLSKGSADVKTALAQSGAGERFANVEAWISVSGLPQGTPLTAWLRCQPLRRLGVTLLLWMRGQRYSVVEELADEPDRPLALWPELPRHLRIIHVVGFPLRRHLRHRWASRAYQRLHLLGPNDGGGFLLADVARLPGFIIPVWGADHYLQPDWDVTSLLRTVFAEGFRSGDSPRHASQSAVQPSIPPTNRSTA